VNNKQSNNARLLALEEATREIIERIAELEKETYGQPDKRHCKQMERLSRFPFEQKEVLQDILDSTKEKEAAEDLQSEQRA